MKSQKLNDKSTIYEPNHTLRAGIAIWAEMFKELVGSHDLIWRFIVRDISARYKQSLLGLLWAFLSPLVLTIVFIWIKSTNVLPIKDTQMPYASFVFLGQMIWLLFSHGITTSANSLVEAGSLLTRINFPRETLIISSLGQAIFEFLIRIPLLVIIFFWTGFLPKITILLIPVLLLPLLLMIVGIGFFVSLLNAITRDIGAILGIAVTLGMFAAPVIYPAPTEWPLSFLVNYINPVSSFISGSRDLAVNGYLTDPRSYITSVLFSIIIFLVSWRIFHLIEPKIAERV